VSGPEQDVGNSAATQRVLWLFVAIGIFIRLPSILVPMPRLLTFVADDFFYYDRIALHLAQDGRPTFDGVTLTSGFQPAYQFLWAAFRLVATSDPETAARISVAWQQIFAVVSGLFLFSLLRRIAGPVAGLVGAGIWLLNPFAVQIPGMGVETGLTAFAVTGTMAAYCGVGRHRTLAVALGCAVLPAVRLDVGLLSALIALFEARRSLARGLLFAAAAPSLVVPWFLWCGSHIGGYLPGSGAAAFLDAHTPFFLATDPRAQPIAFVLNGLQFFQQFVESLGARMGLGGAQPVELFTLAAAALAWMSLGVPRYEKAWSALAPLWGTAVGTMAFFGIVLWHGQTWYFVPAVLALCCSVGLVSAAIGDWFVSWRSAPARPVAEAGAPIVWPYRTFLLVALASSLAWWNIRFTLRDGMHPHAIGFYQAALEIRDHTPPGARIGAFNAGTIASFSNRTVFNLDGITNAEALEALRARDLSSYLARAHVDYLTDQPRVLHVFSIMGLHESDWRMVWQSAIPLRDDDRPAIYARR